MDRLKPLLPEAVWIKMIKKPNLRKLLRAMELIIGVPAVILLAVGFANTLEQAITGNVTCCHGDLGEPISLYMVLVPAFILVSIVKLVRKKLRKQK